MAAPWRRQRPDRASGPLRVLVTGAGGPAAIAAMKSLRADPSVELLAADMDPWAAGLYLVPPEARTLIPAGAAPGFTDALLALAALRGRPLPASMDFRECAVVRFLDERVIDPADVTSVGHGLSVAPA